MKRPWNFFQASSNSITIEDASQNTMCEITTDPGDIGDEEIERAHLIVDAVNNFGSVKSVGLVTS